MGRPLARLSLITGLAGVAASAVAQDSAPMPTPAPVPAPIAEPADPQRASGGGRYTLDANGQWVPVQDGAAEDATIAQAKSLLAQNQPQQALRLLDPWIKQRLVDPPPEMAEALLRRGDARVATGDEFQALYDYERIVRFFPASEQFVLALERELEIAVRYLNGLRAKGWFGLRYESAIDIGEELLIRVQERMPGSQLAERAGIELADYYYRIRDLKMAGEAYDIFLRNFPRSEYRQRAELRRIFSKIAQFKGPRYDAQPLREAKERVKQFAKRFPAEAEQTGVSDALATRLDESTAAQMLEVGLWYLKRDNPVSAKLTFRRLLRAHPETVAARRAEDLFRENNWPLPQAASTQEAAAAGEPTTGGQP
jgi:outer membrane protein assembly factor BamD (BamD/ComL family)